jgi:hypothetical protein
MPYNCEIPAPGVQFVVGPYLDDAGSVEHDDQVCHSNRGKAVGNKHRNPAGIMVFPCGRGVAFEQGVFGFGVQGGGWFVQHEQKRAIAHEATSEGELLPLAERNLGAVRPGWTELGLEAVRQARNDIVGARPFDGGTHGRASSRCRHRPGRR